jgi:hypothetical protein
MKELLFLGVATLAAGYLMGQGVSDWLNQNAQQVKELQQQIVALKAYTVVLQEGYRVIADGLRTIGGIKQTDFTEHENYFASLDAVNPVLSGDPRVVMIRQYCQDVILLSGMMEGQGGGLGDAGPGGSGLSSVGLSGAGLGGIVAANLRLACDRDEQLLERVLTPGVLQLEDVQRWYLVGELYANARARDIFSKQFLAEWEVVKKRNL